VKEEAVRFDLRPFLAVCIAFVLMLGLGLGLGSARAGERWVVPGRFYVEGGGGGEYVDLPALTAFSQFPGKFSSIDDHFWMWSAEAALGFADPDGTTIWDPVGENARIELHGRYSRGTSDNSDTGDDLYIIPPDLTPIMFVALPNNLAESHTLLETWEGDLTYQTDVTLSSHWTFSPLVGLTYTRLRLEDEYRWNNGFSTRELDDKTRSHYYGGALGMDLSFRPVRALELGFGVRGDLMGATASMHSRNGGFEESDHATSFAGRGTASLRAEATFGPLSIGLEGFARYLSYLPVAKNPTADSYHKAEIDHEAMWSTGGRGHLTLWF
jgi:hypothetical protein